MDERQDDENLVVVRRFGPPQVSGVLPGQVR
jgi:hypothetical protein